MGTVGLVYMTLTGLAVGSFLNLVIDRVPRGQSIVAPPSHCDGCGRRLVAMDLVPVLSYLWLRGKCRYCGGGIPFRAVLVELATGALFGVVVYRFGLTPLTGVILAYGSLFIAILVIDVDHLIIPDKLVFPGMVLAFAAAHFGPVGEERALGETFLRVAAGGAAGLGVLLAIYLGAYLVYRADVGFGFGDVKLGALIGLITGFPEVAIALYFAFLSGGVVAGSLLLLKLRSRGDAIAYGPFLVAGAIATLVVGEDLGWYVDLFR